MRKKTLILFSLICFFWACENEGEFAPEIQQVVPGQSFTISNGETVHISTENVTLSGVTLEGWSPNSFWGPHSTARLMVEDNTSRDDISIIHNLKCEFEFIGKGEHCERTEEFFTRLDSLSHLYSNSQIQEYLEVAPLGNDLKLYLLMVTPEEDSNDDYVKVKSAEFLIRKAD